MNFKTLMVVVAMMLTTQLSFAAGATKVAVLDIQAVVLLSEAGKAGMAQLEKNTDYISLKAKFDNAAAELKALSEKEQSDGLTWGEEQKSAHTNKLTELAKEQQATVAQLNRGREGVFMQLLKIMEPAIGQATEMIMEAEGIELVLDSKAVVLKVPTADISQMVVAKINDLSSKAAAAKNSQQKTSK